MKKIIVFDFDYTLGDSTDGIVASANYALETMGRNKAEVNAIKKTIGLSLVKTYEALTGDSNPDQAEQFRTYFIKKADDVMVPSSSFYDGVLEMLKNLRKKGLKTAIVTTKHHFRIGGILEKHDATDLIDVIIGGDEVANPKPDPEGLHTLLEKFQISEEEMLYVGDSIVDAQTAQTCGVDFIAVLTGTTSEKDFIEYPHIAILPDVTCIENCFNSDHFVI